LQFSESQTQPHSLLNKKRLPSPLVTPLNCLGLICQRVFWFLNHPRKTGQICIHTPAFYNRCRFPHDAALRGIVCFVAGTQVSKLVWWAAWVMTFMVSYFRRLKHFNAHPLPWPHQYHVDENLIKRYGIPIYYVVDTGSAQCAIAGSRNVCCFAIVYLVIDFCNNIAWEIEEYDGIANRRVCNGKIRHKSVDSSCGSNMHRPVDGLDSPLYIVWVDFIDVFYI